MPLCLETPSQTQPDVCLSSFPGFCQAVQVACQGDHMDGSLVPLLRKSRLRPWRDLACVCSSALEPFGGKSPVRGNYTPGSSALRRASTVPLQPQNELFKNKSKPGPNLSGFLSCHVIAYAHFCDCDVFKHEASPELTEVLLNVQATN